MRGRVRYQEFLAGAAAEGGAGYAKDDAAVPLKGPEHFAHARAPEISVTCAVQVVASRWPSEPVLGRAARGVGSVPAAPRQPHDRFTRPALRARQWSGQHQSTLRRRSARGGERSFAPAHQGDEVASTSARPPWLGKPSFSTGCQANASNNLTDCQFLCQITDFMPNHGGQHAALSDKSLDHARCPSTPTFCLESRI